MRRERVKRVKVPTDTHDGKGKRLLRGRRKAEPGEVWRETSRRIVDRDERACEWVPQGSESLPGSLCESPDAFDEWFRAFGKQPETLVELDVERGSWLDAALRDAVARRERGEWTEREASDMAKVVDALKPGKPGAQKDLDVSDKAHRLAWYEKYMPKLGGERLAKAIDKTWKVKQLYRFRDDNRDKIDRAKELLPDELSPLVKRPFYASTV
jgi:hypothetical protein